MCVYHVPEEAVLCLFHGHLREGYLMLPVTGGLPPGASIVRVHHDWSSRSVCYLVQHESFDVVPDGEIPPRAGMLEYALVKLVMNGPDADVRASLDAARQEGYEAGRREARGEDR